MELKETAVSSELIYDGKIVRLMKDKVELVNGRIATREIVDHPGGVGIVPIDRDGNVYVNEELLEEPYVTDKCLGDCDLEFPYTVPGTGYFVMGDRRSNSVDSRNSVIGAITQEDIIGKIFLRIWPLSEFGSVY